MPDTLDWIVIVGLIVVGVFVSGQWKQYRMLMVSAMMNLDEITWIGAVWFAGCDGIRPLHAAGLHVNM